MNLFTGSSSDEFFGGEVPPQVRRLLDEARNAPPRQMESLLWTAQICSPECLPVYYLLYKFHARLRQYPQAEQAALKGIATAGAQAGLAKDWREVVVSDADFAATGPARFWLFSLKALAFIYLRSSRHEASRELIAKLAELDPGHGLGGEVIAALLEGSNTTRPPT
ncbi:hypothetical protein [Uliginosibacterium aquaticum]|uniref:Tetratricopeptide repeat protein n=1 Tax=Uliginosibacterium aquaticum TaxID=2731212 RepID=A0ABX2IES6_9RHOO|nr:hypothetical protein [Uliginosibacterium aquaticum]NSL54902.1 hypothetical protein [Uliginosibacterium aquaticum]